MKCQFTSTDNKRNSSTLRCTMKGKILVIEDDEAINRSTCLYLKKAGYDCTPAFSGTEAMLLLEKPCTFDLVITDLMLPGVPGEEIVGFIHDKIGLPVVVISAKNAVSDRVELLRGGADDYLVKPFDFEELVARVEARLRKSAIPNDGSLQENTNCLCYKNWKLDKDAHSFSVGGTVISLTPTEFEIISVLMAFPNRVHTKRNLSEAIGGDAAFLEDKTVSTHVGNIRSKLRPFGADDCLETVWGIGFKLTE